MVVVTVDIPGSPVTENSSIADVESAPFETMFPTMYRVVVGLMDCAEWIEKNPLFTVEEKVETATPAIICALLRTQYLAPTKLVERKSLALATNLSSLTPMIG